MLTAIQKEIVEQPGNLVVKASAGTGKTHTMVEKIAHEIKNQHSHKVIAAITFTIKAANEIRNRLSIDARQHFIGTNNSFAIEEIIKPFIKDVYGKEYKTDISTDYSVKIKGFEDGLAQIKEKQLLCSYKNREENFIFQLAFRIVQKSKSCQLYLKSKYFKIYIDEYQDCDKDMHALFMYLCDDLHIDIFVVGDEKQSIYKWRGAKPELFISIWNKENFSKKMLRDNFRSCQQIENYSNLLFEETSCLYSLVTDISPIVVVCATLDNWSSAVLPHIDVDRRCAILRYRNDDAEANAKAMTSAGIDFTFIPQTPISAITTESSWFYTAVANFFILPKYSAYDFRNEIPNSDVGNKKIINTIKYYLATMKRCIDNNKKLEFTTLAEKLACYFGYKTKKDHCQLLYDTIVNKNYHPAFRLDNIPRTSLTVHSSKGLEFDQVILFASDYPLSSDDEVYNHYVAATRAKSKLIIFYDVTKGSKDKKFGENIKKILNKSGHKMRELATIDEIKRSSAR